ncbi:MAG: ferrous iron transport protein A [Bacilli bacterium]
MELNKGKLNQSYTVVEIKTNDESMKEFLFSLGCFPGENLTIISKLAANFVISVKDARYSIDENLAKCIIVE